MLCDQKARYALPEPVGLHFLFVLWRTKHEGCKTSLMDVCRLMEVESETFDEARGEAETLGGLLLEIAGRIPRNGEAQKGSHYYYAKKIFHGSRF